MRQATVTAGLMWAPLMCPKAWTSVLMAKPKASAIWRMLGEEAEGQFRAEPRPKRMKTKVAKNSARTARVKATDRSSHIMERPLLEAARTDPARGVQRQSPLSLLCPERMAGGQDVYIWMQDAEGSPAEGGGIVGIGNLTLFFTCVPAEGTSDSAPSIKAGECSIRHPREVINQP